jgi:large subunit ribosomal protein L13
VSTLNYKTKSINKANADKQWMVVDAKDQTLGRLASRIAMVLRGKHKPLYTPHADCGDNVIVINAEKVKLSGLKWAQKDYIRHTGFPGGQRSLTAEEVMEKNPTRLVEYAVKGMLPKNRLGREILRNLHVFAGEEHNHEAQKPQVLNFNDYKL